MVLFKLRCPECDKVFKLSLPSFDDVPDFCPHCGEYVGGDPEFVPSQMNIGTGKGKAGDVAYRQLEASSEARAEAAGNPALKITNMQDNLREGDVAIKPVNNVVTQYMEAAKDSTGFQPMGLKSALPKAKYNESGAKAMGAIQSGLMSAPPTPSPAGAGFWGAKQ